MRSGKKGIAVRVGEHRVKRDSEDAHHRSRRKRSEEDEKPQEKSRARSSGGEETRQQPGSTKPSIWSWATDGGRAVRPTPRMDKGGASRKDSERRSSKRYVYERTRRQNSLPPRTEKRSVPEKVARGLKDRQAVTRSASYRDIDSVKDTSASRPPLRRSQTTTRKERLTSYESPSSPHRPNNRERAASSSGRTKRPSSIFESVMSSSKSKKPEKQVSCVSCMDEVAVSQANLIKSCGCYWCNSCVIAVFHLSVKDIQNMPPKCCNGKPLQPRPLGHLFDSKFSKIWNEKYKEWTTKDRLYCPGKGCGTWIKPEDIKHDRKGHKLYGKCSTCKRKVCPKCNGKYHPDSIDCPNDPATQAFVKTARKNGWQKCGNCGLTIERTEGCHHMSCPCGFQFCILCGAKWKTCDCAWLSQELVDADRLNHMRVPVFMPPDGQHPPGMPIPMAALNYQQEMHLRREQERRDEALARRLQMLNIDMDADDPELGLPNHIHGMDQDFVQRARNVLVGQHNAANIEEGERLLAELAQQQRGADGVRRYVLRPDLHNNQPQVVIPPAPPRALTPPPRRATNLDPFAAGRNGIAQSRTRASQMAGINRGQRDENRVDEWRNWVPPNAHGGHQYEEDRW